MFQDLIDLKREVLYQQVWSHPVIKVAKQYGLSDVGLAKICRKLKVPLPGIGYWQRKLHGKAVRCPPLPTLKPSDQTVVRIARREKPPPDQTQCTEAEEKIAYERMSEHRIHVEPILLEPHPLVARAEKSLRRAPRNQKGLLVARAKRCLDIAVGPNSLDRALRMMDALIKSLEVRAYEVLLHPNGGCKTTLSVLGEMIEFGIEETTDRFERELTAAQKKEKEKYSWRYARPEYDYIPSGKLSLKIRNQEGSGFRRQWADGKEPVEHRLNAFIIGCITAAVALRAQRLERERREQEWREKERRRLETEKLKQEELERLKALDREVSAWHKSQQIREYVEAVKEAAIRKYGEIPPGSQLDQWLAWATQQADRLDPLVVSPPSILDEKKN